MDFSDISPELREKAKACTSPEEVLELARKEGFELSEDQLAAISGGLGWNCNHAYRGDSREGVDRSRVSSAYAEGKLDARNLDW